MTEKKLEIVISRFREDISWLADTTYRNDWKTIYNKGAPDIEKLAQFTHCRTVSLPNVGREGHSFLYHIVNNYDDLADVTIFLPGSCMDEIKLTKTLDVIGRAKETKDTVIMGKWYDNVRSSLQRFSIDSWEGLSTDNKQAQPSLSCAPSKYRPFGRWFDHFFGRDILVNVVCFTSTFAVAKTHILQHPRRYYEELLDTLSHHSNPEDGHFIERAWNAVFYPIPDHCLLSARPLPPSKPTEPVFAPDSKGRMSMSAMLRKFSGERVVGSQTSDNGIARARSYSQKPFVGANTDSLELRDRQQSVGDVHRESPSRLSNGGRDSTVDVGSGSDPVSRTTSESNVARQKRNADNAGLDSF